MIIKAYPHNHMTKRVVAFSVGVLTGLAGGVWSLKLRNEVPENINLEEKNLEESLFKYGKPDSCISTHAYESHVLAYDRRSKIPLWVMERMTREEMKKEKTANRKKSTFKPDPTLPSVFNASNDDYWHSGWSRGHMAAAGNYKHCQKSMDDTFFLTNIVPQDINNNCNYWNRLEIYCRNLAKEYDEVRVISGPLFLPEEKKDGKRYVQYQAIGNGHVSVPTHLFKIILAETSGNAPLLGCFEIPNKPIKDVPLTDYQVPLEDIEKHTGSEFLKHLQKHKIFDLCEKESCKLMSSTKMDSFIYTKRIQSARDMKIVTMLWTEISEKGLVVDDQLKQAYEKKLYELKHVNK